MVGGVSLVSVRDVSACHSGAAVPRGSSVLRGSCFLSFGLGWVPGLLEGSPTSGWLYVLLPVIVPEAVPPSSRLGLRLRSGFLFSEPGVCGGFNRLLVLRIPSGCGHPLGQKCLCHS